MNGHVKVSRPVAFIGMTAMLSAIMAVVVLMVSTPTVYLEGAELRRAADGSVQLLATVSIEHVNLAGGLNFNMDYDPQYLTPSNFSDNKALVDEEHKSYSFYSDNGGKEFYRPVESLYGGGDPFLEPMTTIMEDGSTGTISTVMLRNKSIDVATESLSDEERANGLRHEAGKVYSLVGRTENTTIGSLVIDAKDKTPLVQLSFRVKEDKLPMIVSTFQGKQEGSSKGDKAANGTWTDNYLIRLTGLNSATGISIPYWEFDSTNYYTTYGHSYNEIDTQVRWNFEDTVIDAEAVEKMVTINAFEAYGDGTPADIAAALLRYSPTIRTTHADGHLEDIVMDWGANAKATGENGGCYITTGGDKYHLTRAADGSYSVEKYDAGTTSWTELTDDSWYDPRRGTYEVTQTLYYEIEGGIRKEYPYDIKVTLTVTPVNVTGVVAEDLAATYVTDGTPAAPGTYSGLRLPGTAQVTTDVVPGQVSLTMPIQSWVSEATAADIAADLTGLTGTGSVSWPAVGTYAFKARSTSTKLVYDEPVIRGVYPWLTVPGTYSLDAIRTILDDGQSVPTFEIYYGHTDDNGVLTLKIGKKDAEGNWVDMLENDVFRLMLPNGTIIDDAWLTASDVTRTDTYGAGSDANGNRKDYTITLRGATTTDKAKLTSASINLGGYFQVATTEPGQNESDFVGRYVAPRLNLYTQNYTGDNAFDFTGERAALYPFYRNSVLPDYVLLPAGYTVKTTYDGLTGAEDGELNRFKVDAWRYASTQNGSGSGGAWTPNQNATMTIRYGVSGGNNDVFAASYSYSDYGLVENPNPTKTVQVNVEVQASAAPTQAESVCLTYEGTGDTVTTHANGEAKRIIFDTQQVGYQYRQSVTLTLTNNGTTDITGIYIDNTGENAHNQEFIITQTPAENLPVGASTTFTVSYIWTLTNEDADAMTHRAIDAPIKIYSANSTSTPIKTFEAEFTVTRGPVYQLYVRTVPADGSLGTAAPVAGQSDHTPVGYTFAENSNVWLLATPATNQAVSRIYYVDGTDKICTLLNAAANDKVNKLANFKMPAHDTVVYVEFEESTYSKLRLIDLQGWAGETPTILNNGSASGAGHQLPLMLHDSQDGTVVYATDFKYSDNVVRTTANYTMTPTKSTVIENDDLIQLTEDEYLVVIPADAEYSQVRLTLRDNTTDTLFWPDIQISTDYGYGLPTRINDWSAATVAAAADSRNHTSAEFTSPAQGERMKALITLKHDDEERTYTLIIARRLPDDAQLAYPLTPGNSPYGMILWDWGNRDAVNTTTLTFDETTQTSAAKTAYNANDRFEGVTVTPSKARNVLTRTYWQQAWGTGTNYDKVDTALFVFVGEAFNDYGPITDQVTNTAGDVIKNEEITRTLTGLKILGSGTTQKEQYEGATTLDVTLDLGKADVTTIPASIWSYDIMDGENVTGTAVYKVRPGIYQLTYSYTDYDGQKRSFTRPLIVLNRVGDLDQSTQADPAARLLDKSMLDRRVTAPLGYEAAGYSEAALYRSRVCDANNDRNINQVDANTILWDGMTQFYLPTGYKS